MAGSKKVYTKRPITIGGSTVLIYSVYSLAISRGLKRGRLPRCGLDTCDHAFKDDPMLPREVEISEEEVALAKLQGLMCIDA